MTQSVYVIGGAGTGKSTFMDRLLRVTGCQMGPLADLKSKPNSRGTVITLRGHGLIGEPGEGVYLGCMRDSFPGTDGLDRVSYIPGEAWLEEESLPDFIVAEGATLAARRFIRVLHQTTSLLLILLETDDVVKDLRMHQRGSDQDPSFVKATATRSYNLAHDMDKEGVSVWTVEDTSCRAEWEQAIAICRDHLLQG